jgi:hypothetical protein
VLALTGWKECRGTALTLCRRMGKKLVRIDKEGRAPRYAAW